MATPVLTYDSPALGAISWPEFHIQYEGVGYTVPAGSTFERWTWWRFNGGVPVLEYGPTLPQDLTDDDLVLFGNKNGIGVRIQSSTLIDGELIVDGSILAKAVSAEIMVANEIYSRLGYFGDLQAQQIVGGSIKADIGLLAKLTIDQITIDPLVGITVPSPKGNTVLSSTGLGSRFAGAVETDDLTVNGGLTLNGANNSINGTLKLANVIVAPPTKPNVARMWPYSAPIGADTYSITDSHDGTKWVTIYVGSSNNMWIRTYLKTTGALVNTYKSETDFNGDYVPYNISRVGAYFFAVCWRRSTNSWYLMRFTSDFSGFATVSLLASVSSTPYAPVCGPNLINGRVVVVWASNDTNMRYQEYTTASNSDPVITELWNHMDLGLGGQWLNENSGGTGVVRGNIGFGGVEALATSFGYGVRFWDVTTKRINWQPSTAENIKGLCRTVDNKFVYMGYNTYRMYEWVTEAPWDTASITFKYAWYDSKIAGTGKHETTPSPIFTITSPTRWAAYQVDTAAVSNTGQDDSPDSVAVYINDHRQPDPGVGKTSIVYRNYDAAGAAPKTSNEFIGAVAYPGAMVSEATLPDGITPRLRMRGDGTGNWGDLVVDGNGKAVIGGDSGWIDATSFVLGWENYGGTYRTVGWRKIGNRVWLKGLIRGPGNVKGSMFTLPVGFRPPAALIFGCPVNSVTDTFAATGDNPATFNTGTPNNATTAHTHPVNIPTMDIQTAVSFNGLSSRVDVTPDGVVALTYLIAAPATTWVSLEGVSFLID